MSLVAYDYSDDENDGNTSETEDVESSSSNLDNKDTTNKISSVIESQESSAILNELSKDETNKFITLPSSGSLAPIGIDVSWSVLDKHRTQPIRIPIPPLNTDKNEENSKGTKIKSSTKGSGLFSILPRPKSEMVPPSLTPKQIIRKKPMKVTKLQQPKKTEVVDKGSESENEDETENNSFFFLPQTEIPQVEESAIDLPEITHEKEEPSPDVIPDEPETPGTSFVLPLPQNQESGSEKLDLDKEALAKLCGTRDRRKMKQEFVEVDGNALLGDPKEWLTKELSKETARISTKRKGDHTPLQKRKHQITYLAQHAKAHELELQNQWSNNRMTKKQTQAKYGF